MRKKHVILGALLLSSWVGSAHGQAVPTIDASLHEGMRVEGVSNRVASESSIVPKDSWIYGALKQIAYSYDIKGVAPSQLKKEKPLTRIEMASLVAKVMPKLHYLQLREQVLLGRLVTEFGPELQQMGLTVDELKAHPRVDYKMGDIRVRYRQTPYVTDVINVPIKQNPTPDEVKAALAPLISQVGPDVGNVLLHDIRKAEKAIHIGMAPGATMEQKMAAKIAVKKLTSLGRLKRFNRYDTTTHFDVRLRMNFLGGVNKNTKVIGRLLVEKDFNDSKEHFTFDRMMIWHHMKNWDLIIGRQQIHVGGGLAFDDTFDGILASYKKGDTRYSLAYGYPNHYTGYAYPGVDNAGEDPSSMGSVLDPEHRHNLVATLGQVQTKIGQNSEVKAFYLIGNDNAPVNAFGITYEGQFDKIWVGAEYIRLLKAEDLPQPYGYLASLVDDHYAWTAAVGYGTFNTQKPKSWDVKLRYLWEGRVSPVMNNYSLEQPFLTNYKAWNIAGRYTIKKDLVLNGSIFFNGKNKVGNEKYDNSYMFSLAYSF